MSPFAARSAVLPFALWGVIACEGTLDVPGSERGSGPSGANTGSGAGVSSGSGAGGSSSGGGEACTSAADASPLVLRRLTKLEYQFTLQELFQLASPPDVADVPEDSNQGGFRTIAEFENVTDQHLRAYVDHATELASALLADPARRTQVLGCEPDAAGCLDSFITSFGRLAYRRPLDATEIADLSTRAQASAVDLEDQYRYVFEALLSSPSFLFRVEIGDGAALATLSPLELASRLSFTLWGRGPSGALLDAAQAGELDTDAGLAAVADEMLADPRAATFFRAFFKQWLNFETLVAPSAPPEGWSDALLPQMIGETEALIDEFAWGPDRSLPDMLTANFTYLTPELGAFYGIDVQGTGSVRVDIPSGHPRENTGLLTHAAVISAKRDGDIIPARGKWVRQSFLCEELEVPPGLLEGLQSELAGLSYVEVIAMRNTEVGCAHCHVLIDPVGAAFVQYDGIGKYDPSVSPSDFGLVPRFEGAEDPEFSTLAELAVKLKAMPQVGACMAEKLFVYTQGRFPLEQDHCALDEVAARFGEEGFRFPALARAIVASPAFRLRRAPSP